MDPVKIGIIGCGVIGTQHARAATASPLIDLVAVADLKPEAREKMAAEYKVPKAYDQGEALLADPGVEAVVLAMPTCIRTGLALKAFARGKHVLTEKPVAMNAREVEQLIKARGKLTAGCCSCRYRLTDSAKAASDFIASGRLGTIRKVYVRDFFPAGARPERPRPEWRLKRSLNGGGILVNWGCYDLDYLLGITGWTLEPTVVLAQAWPVSPPLEPHVAPGSDAETHYTAFIRCAGQTVITAERGEYMPIVPEGSWQIIGDNGTLIAPMRAKGSKKIFFMEAHTEKGCADHPVWEGEHEGPGPHLGPVHDFADAILNRRPPLTSLEQALVIQKITDAIYASAESGKAVEIT